ncbi:helix-turn-helix transcriptional regulator [Haladaptatus sp. DYSN1]|uniref:ArsR/SmtB family transcription factor n=1 Tax=unclassified Haladaptatus TaxID=2622732 RepID=UPI0024059639|nr:helix-turn-helix domain-containing protein [Haladaptatus sp. DYSN1]
MNDSRADTRPDEAFALLGNETRVAILRELADASDTPLSFSALRERVGMRDSGQFNYHLGKLTGIFIDKVDAGYRLRYAGAHVMGAILAGAYEQAGTVGPFSLDDPCPVCGGTLEFSYEDERALVVCADCDRTTLQSSVPPGVFDGYDPHEYPMVYDRWIRSKVRSVIDGFCLSCEGRSIPEVLLDPEEFGTDDRMVRFTCVRCDGTVYMTIPEALVTDPAVVAFHHEQGVALDAEPTWRLEWLDDTTVETVSTDPLRLRVTGHVGDGTLRVTIDDSLTVLETTRDG